MDSSEPAGLTLREKLSNLKNCEPCQKRKESLKQMAGKHFWFGVIVGVGGVWAYGKFVKKGS